MARVAAVGLILLAVVSAGCQPDEYAILISARSEADVETLSVTVIPTDGGGRPHPSGARPIRRTRDDIRDNEPIRVAIDLDGPREVMVHLSASDGAGGTLVATRCYSVRGVVEDRVMLVAVNDTIDGDGDGWAGDPSATCFDPDGEGSTPCAPAYRCETGRAEDCNDGDDTIYPGAPELCADGVDQDCDGDDAPCDDVDGDGWRKCSAMDLPGTCDCNDDVATVNPDAEETCGDGVDQDCDGADLQCDEDGDGFRAGRDCDDTDPAINPDADEQCTPEGGEPRDEDCDGLVDELPECAPSDLDQDGVIGCGHPDAPADCDCNDCDSGVHPGATDFCGDGVDEDCDGSDAACPVGDMDHDGFAGTASGGADCDDTDPTVFPGAPERCGDGVSQSCATDQSCDGDTDGDGYVEPPACEGDASIVYYSSDVCNGVNDDCDAQADEVLHPPSMVGGMTLPHGDDGCVRPNATVPGCEDAACVVDFRTNVFHCGACRAACNTTDNTVADQCVDAVCDCSTEPGLAACTGGKTCCVSPAAGCQDLQTEILHCGGCGADCNDGRPGFHPRADACMGGSCQCGGGAPCSDDPFQICCGGSCTDPMTDEMNCGACGQVCGPRSTCVAGRCECDSPYLDCNGDIRVSGCETDPRTDLDHCGGCMMPCRRDHATQMCSGGTCSIDTCDVGWKSCDGTDSSGCETPLDTLTDCGDCDVSCSLAHATESCSTRSCRITGCDPLWGDCSGGDADGCETPLDTLSDCGACGVGCSRNHATASCSGGSCHIQSCDSGWGDCDGNDANGCEQRLNTLTHCGACDTPCSRSHATATCSTGSCAIATGGCDPGWDDCDGTDSNGCEQSLNAVSDCGSCDMMCSAPSNATASCTSMSCGWSCNSGYHDCSGTCASNSDTATCGSRCSPCPDPANGSPTCDGSSCGISCNSGYHDCSGSCVSNGDTATCGSRCSPCPNPSNGSATCDGSSCGVSCDAGFHNCSGTCASNTDVATCGSSCSPCASHAHTSGGCDGTSCTYSCDAGFADCNGSGDGSDADGCEVNVSGDTGNCGGCGVMCPLDETCSGGACTCGGESGAVGGGAVCTTGGMPTCCISGGTLQCVNNPSSCD